MSVSTNTAEPLEHVTHEVQRPGSRIAAYKTAASLPEASLILRRLGTQARVIAGGTDLILELDRGARPDVNTLIDITGIPELSQISADLERVWLPCGVTHAQVVQSELCRSELTPLAQACLEVGSPQLRNTATVVGNVVTASPANDTLSALLALDTVVEIVTDTDRRSVPLEAFITGYRSVDLLAHELVSQIGVRRLQEGETAMFAKSGLRRAQAISVVHLSARLRLRDEVVDDLVVAVGSIGPTVEIVDADFKGLRLNDEVISRIASTVSGAVAPIDDLRATADYRRAVLETMIRRVLAALRDGEQLATWPVHSPSLATNPPGSVSAGESSGFVDLSSPADTADTQNASDQPESMLMMVNGTVCSGPRDPAAVLLDWLRTNAGAHGVKEGCAEGECGACTVICDGAAVLSCIVPAVRMEQSTVRTVEGLASQTGRFSPIQQAFVDCGAVQCGFCTPGFLMAATALLEEVPSPRTEQILDGLAGNLCRCTGYDSIVRAVQAAAKPTHQAHEADR